MTDRTAKTLPVEPELMDFDPFGLDLRARPDELFPDLIARSPGFMMVEGRRSAFVASFEDVRAVSKDYESFSSVKPSDVPGMNRFDFFNGQPVMNYADPPEHDRRRRVVNASFTRRRIEQLDVDTLAIIDDLLRGLNGTEVVDVMGQLCSPMSIEVLLGAFMNVAPADRQVLFAMLIEFGTLDKLQPGEPKSPAWLQAWDAGAAYCRRAIAEAREEKSETLIGLIAAASAEGGTISDDEMMAMMMVLLTGGLSTMAAAAASALRGIAAQPELKERIRNDPSLATAALDEGMRLYPPVTFSMRFATQDTPVNGTVIPAGTPVYVLWSAANHDPAAFPDPLRFDLDRPNVRTHVAFGFGVHNCIGNHVTRQVGSLLVRAVIERFPDFRLADPDQEPEFNLGSARGRHLLRVPMILGAPSQP
jgi:cholest-4-en-3-one 26-monooxygenase